MSFINYFDTESLTEALLVVSVVFYFAECFFGFRMIKYLISLVGFSLGYIIGYFTAVNVYDQKAYIPVIAGLVLGALLALVSFKLYMLGVFLFCGILAATAVSNLPLGAEGAQNVLKTILCAAAFIIVGILAVKFSKKAIIVVTSAAGAVNAVNLLQTPIRAIGENGFIKIGLILAAAILGIIFQNATTRRLK